MQTKYLNLNKKSKQTVNKGRQALCKSLGLVPVFGLLLSTIQDKDFSHEYSTLLLQIVFRWGEAGT